jgi:peptide chain release factor 1
MKESLFRKLEAISERLTELDALLADPGVIRDQFTFRAYAREHSEIGPVVECFNKYSAALETINSSRAMTKDADPDIRELAAEELKDAELDATQLADNLQVLLLPKDPKDDSNIFLEIRAGTGGNEAALFAADVFRMYTRYAESRGWSVEILNDNASELGGHKEIIARVIGRGAYSRMKFESGAHRVQRVPETESQGRIHTSACTVAVLPETEEVGEIEVRAGDLRIDTFRASGAGGQHVNKTDSAIRITHLPSGIVVECQDERSQHKNKARAMSLLKAKLTAAERDRQQAEIAQNRRDLVGSGDRSQRIRTYNFPQGRVTDHRINLKVERLEGILGGELDVLIEPLIQEHQADLIAELGD